MAGFNGIVHNDHQELVHLLLDEVSVKVFICDVSARVLLTQKYTNTASTATSRAKYVFPVPSRAAVCAFELTHADGRVIVGEAKEKGKAAKEHEEAVKEGRFTSLLEWATDDVFTISVGSVAAKQSVITKLVYVLDLMEDEHANQIRFQLPVALGQRYGTPPPGLSSATSPSIRTRLRITADIQMTGRIRSVSSPTHALSPLIPCKTHTGRSSNRRVTAMFRSASFLQRDFALVVEANGLDAPRCLAERDMRLGTIAMQLTLVPKFQLPPIPAQEYIFVVDRSGSMEDDDRIGTAKRTLKILLRMLPSASEGTERKTKFNVFSFGSLANSLFTEGSREYTEATLNQATSHVEGMDADMGGTEMRAALALALGSRDINMPTVVFVMTDGEAHDIEGTLTTVSTFVAASATTPSASLRVFTLGIGDTVSTAMCEGIARAGEGMCLLATSSESMVGKCARLLRAGRKGVLGDVTLDWGFEGEGALRVQLEQTPLQINHIDPGSRFNVFVIAQVPHRNRNSLPKVVTLRGRLNGTSTSGLSTEITHTVPVDLVKPFSKQDTGTIPLLHTLAARRLITEYEEGREPGPLFAGSFVGSTEDAKEKVIVHMGEEYQLASKYTSFVAVDGTPVRVPSTRELYGPQARRSRRAGSVGSLGVIADTAFSVMGWVAGGIGAVLNYWGNDSEPPRRGRSSRVPGAFTDSRSGSISPARSVSIASRSTMSSLLGSQSDWTPSRTPSPSPPPSIEDLGARSPSPILEPQPRTTLTRRQEPSRPPISPQIIDLVQLQAFDGSFALNEAFGEIVGKDNMARAAEFQVDERTWATALAVAFLRKHLAMEPDLLEGLLDKAMEFVRGDANFESLVTRARALIT